MSRDGEFGDLEAKRIIERAAEIDAQRGHPLDAKALREIALEAGISPGAVDQAIGERLERSAVRPSWAARHRGLLISIAIVVALLLLRLIAPTA